MPLSDAVTDQRRRGIARAMSLVLAAYWIALAVATHVPLDAEHVRLGAGRDKIIHFAAYCGLTILLFATLRLYRISPTSTARRAAIGLPIYAALDELLQTPLGRDGNLPDWLADVAGIAAGLVLALACHVWWWWRNR